MGTTFHGPNPWPHITRAIRTRGPRRAAIAYLGQDAPELLPLRAGDVLVVNASKAAIRAHATSPAALTHYLGKGVRILSCPTLHANVIATTRRAVIGSANATVNSTFADDAVIITDDPDIITSVRTFINSLDDLTEIDQPFIDNATREWAIGRAVPIPGVTGRIRNPDNDFLPTPAARMFIKHVVDYQPSPTEQHLLEEQQPQPRTTAGPVAKYQLQSLHLGKPSTITSGDVIVLVSADNEWIYPPALVTSEPVRIPRSGGAVLVFLRIRTDLPPLPLPVAEKHLADHGHPGPRLRTDHYIRSESIRTALLQLWKL
ncbi:phospholipase D family protein [Rhodococcus sp. ARC_M6]|uniref:phospholipase D family protein n=1 Tax=Rhodococcus sp. ARC_M6 TaxID=2928852 RepID=UPI001FB30BB8|nr:phospholipase D family protein [Rhodococcus sp. ARC_M6]MCJ0907322.1 phospholipase D family protein [Rhodococcus sp. ARC_M6]